MGRAPTAATKPWRSGRSDRVQARHPLLGAAPKPGSSPAAHARETPSSRTCTASQARRSSIRQCSVCAHNWAARLARTALWTRGGRSERHGETVTGVGGRQTGFLCVSCGPEVAGWMLPFRISGRRLTEWDYCLRCVLQAAWLNAALSYVHCCCRLQSSSTASEPELSPSRGQTPAQAKKGAPEPGPG
jgi:hypothetical protein